MLRLLVGALTCGALLVPTAGIAIADTGDNVPPTANAGAWADYVTRYKSQPDWAPQGAVVADTGFRSFPDGFSFFNTGVPDRMNNRVFGSPLKGPKNLDAEQMRSLMGKRVCVERSATGTCTLTPAAQLWMDSANASMSGGHCFGFATTAAELFNKTVRPEQFQPGITRTYDLAPAEPVERNIARNMAAQYMMNISEKYLIKPRQVVEMLKRGLTAGNLPYTLVMFWGEGGHAITPYALHDRGDGQYDVAVYDNNYPDAARAVRIDTKANTYQYLVGVNPNEPPTIASGEIGLVPVSEIAKRQTCPFCGTVNQTTVKLSAVRTQQPIRTQVFTLNGKKLKGVEVRKPTTPWRPGQKWEFPTYVIPKNKQFVVGISGEKRKKPFSVDVTATTGDIVVGTSSAVIPAKGVGAVGLVPSKGLIVYRGEGPNEATARLGQLSFVNSMPDGSVMVQAATGRRSEYLVGRIQTKQARVVLYTPEGRASNAQAVAILSFADEGESVRVGTVVRTRLPEDGELVFDYSAWSKKKPQGLKAYVVHNGTQKRVKLKFQVVG